MTDEQIIIELNRELFTMKSDLNFQKEEKEKYSRWWQEDSDKVKLKDQELKELYNVINNKDQEICAFKDELNTMTESRDTWKVCFEAEEEKHRMSVKKLKDTNKELNAENSQLSADFEAYKLKNKLTMTPDEKAEIQSKLKDL